jgi:hypothetical protein
MHLHRPQDQLAGCVWLPRFVDKARLSLDRQLPFLYQLAFGSRFGVDGYFLRHFGLSIEQFLAAVRQSTDNAALARWFLRFPAPVHNASVSGIDVPQCLAPRDILAISCVTSPNGCSIPNR